MSQTQTQPVDKPSSTFTNFNGTVIKRRAYNSNVKMATCLNFWVYVWSQGESYETLCEGGQVAKCRKYHRLYARYSRRWGKQSKKQPAKNGPVPMPRLSKLRKLGLVPTPTPAPRPPRTFA